MTPKTAPALSTTPSAAAGTLGHAVPSVPQDTLGPPGWQGTADSYLAICQGPQIPFRGTALQPHSPVCLLPYPSRGPARPRPGPRSRGAHGDGAGPGPAARDGAGTPRCGGAALGRSADGARWREVGGSASAGGSGWRLPAAGRDPGRALRLRESPQREPPGPSGAAARTRGRGRRFPLPHLRSAAPRLRERGTAQGRARRSRRIPSASRAGDDPSDPSRGQPSGGRNPLSATEEGRSRGNPPGRPRALCPRLTEPAALPRAPPQLSPSLPGPAGRCAPAAPAPGPPGKAPRSLRRPGQRRPRSPGEAGAAPSRRALRRRGPAAAGVTADPRRRTRYRGHAERKPTFGIPCEEMHL
nr:translation initiation factor IF-2-like [Taeniopygia guttata]